MHENTSFSRERIYSMQSTQPRPKPVASMQQPSQRSTRGNTASAADIYCLLYPGRHHLQMAAIRWCLRCDILLGDDDGGCSPACFRSSGSERHSGCQ